MSCEQCVGNPRSLCIVVDGCDWGCFEAKTAPMSGIQRSGQSITLR